MMDVGQEIEYDEDVVSQIFARKLMQDFMSFNKCSFKPVVTCYELKVIEHRYTTKLKSCLFKLEKSLRSRIVERFVILRQQNLISSEAFRDIVRNWKSMFHGGIDAHDFLEYIAFSIGLSYLYFKNGVYVAIEHAKDLIVEVLSQYMKTQTDWKAVHEESERYLKRLLKRNL